MRRRLIFGLIPLLVVVIAVELASFAYREAYCPGDVAGLAVPNEKFGWMHPAGVRRTLYGCVGENFEWRTTATFNSKGLHDDEHSYEPRPGYRRVLVLGDSVAEALQVDRPSNFTDRLEEMFRADGQAVEVVNAGHSGFGTDNETLFFETEGIRYRPDVVLLELNLQNDLAENSESIVSRMYRGGGARPKAAIAITADGGISLDPSGFSKARTEWLADPWRSWPALEWLRGHSFFARRISNLLRTGVRPRTPDWPTSYPAELEVYLDPPTQEWMEARSITEALLRRLRTAVEASGASLLVAVIPSRETVSHEEWRKLVAFFPSLSDGDWNLDLPHEWSMKFLASEDFHFVDVRPTLGNRQRETGLRGFFDTDPHPNSNGHSWIAEAIYPDLNRMLFSREFEAER